MCCGPVIFTLDVMKFMRDAGLVILAAVAGLFAATPVPPWSEAAELVSASIAFLTFVCLLFLPQLRVHRAVLGGFIGAVPLLRVLAELAWGVVPYYLPHSFFFLAKVLGADGEGAYNASTYQVFLVLVVTALLISIALLFSKSAQARKPPAAAGSLR